MAFDPAAATAAYIDSLGPSALAKAAAYTSGGHWIMLWGVLVSALCSWIVIRLGLLDSLSAKLAARGFFLRTWIVCTAALLILSILALPWDIYVSWWRERAYGQTSQSLGDYLAQGSVALAMTSVMGGLFFTGVYALIRKAGRTWWLWSGGLAALSISAMLLLSPILIQPLFNNFKPVPAGPVRDALITMADQAHIPHDRIFVYDGSRQSNNFTANVSGIMGTARIAISDVALGKASLEEVKAVTGHEIGHYVLGHVWRTAAAMSVMIILFFWLADRLFPRVARLFGRPLTIGDAVALPVLMLLVSILSLLTLPITNWTSRLSETEADAYSLQTVNLPDALATALVKTAEYRDPRPGPVAEFIFDSHPSVEHRVRAAMEWKATHPSLGTGAAKPAQ